MNIIELARQADALAEQKETDKEWIQDFANLIIEECAKVAYEEAKRTGYNVLSDNSTAAIRAMKK